MDKRRRFHLEPDFLNRWGNVFIFCLLVFVSGLLVFGSLHSVYFDVVRAWWVVLPVCVVLARRKRGQDLGPALLP